MNMHDSKQTARWLFLELVEQRYSIVLLSYEKPDSIICLLLIFGTIRSLIANSFWSGFQTKAVAINRLMIQGLEKQNAFSQFGANDEPLVSIIHQCEGRERWIHWTEPMGSLDAAKLLILRPGAGIMEIKMPCKIKKHST